MRRDMASACTVWRAPALFADVTFDVGAGEIVGMYGLVGSGRSEIARCIFGADRATAGTITWRDKPFAARSPKQALGEGIALLTEDRLGDGLVRGMSVRDNASLASLAAISRWGMLRKGLQRRRVEEQVRSLAIRPAGIERDVAALSGGNQQKVVLAKWLLTDAKTPDPRRADPRRRHRRQARHLSTSSGVSPIPGSPCC